MVDRCRVGATDAAGHADTMVSVPGNGIDATPLFLRCGHDIIHRFEDLADCVGSFLGLSGHGHGNRVSRCLRRSRSCGDALAGHRNCGTGIPSVGGGVGGGSPQFLEFIVEPRDSQRAAGHVEAGHQLADLRQDDLDPGRDEQRFDRRPQHKELFVLRGAETVEQYRGAGGTFGAFGQEPIDQS